MATIQTYTKSGTRATSAAKLNKDIFNVEVKNHELLKAAYVAYLANGRGSDAQTKTRGLISGGGRKPWKQKGTGRARFGSSRNPIWRGGGIVFGPTGQENHTHRMSTQMKRQALRQALSLAANEGSIKIVEGFTPKDGKTQEAVAYMNKIEATGNVLLVVADKTPAIDRSTRNITNMQVITAKYLTVYDILNSDVIVMDQQALDTVHEWLDVTAPASAKEAK